MQKLLKIFFNLFFADNLRFIIFSNYEKKYYATCMELKATYLLSIPYGDWVNNPEEERAIDLPHIPYYFSGGYSNRDYAGLIKAWEKIDKKLVIIGSQNNADLYAYSLEPNNPNIEVLMDTPSEVFDRCLGGAKACILPFKSDSGAAGQTVALRCMKRGKLIISSRITAMVEYTDNGRTGFLVDDLASELPNIIRKIEERPDDFSNILKEQKQLFDSKFSYDVITKKLLDLF